jgi:hypothetical protein
MPKSQTIVVFLALGLFIKTWVPWLFSFIVIIAAIYAANTYKDVLGEALYHSMPVDWSTAAVTLGMSGCLGFVAVRWIYHDKFHVDTPAPITLVTIWISVALVLLPFKLLSYTTASSFAGLDKHKRLKYEVTAAVMAVVLCGALLCWYYTPEKEWIGCSADSYRDQLATCVLHPPRKPVCKGLDLSNRTQLARMAGLLGSEHSCTEQVDLMTECLDLVAQTLAGNAEAWQRGFLYHLVYLQTIEHDFALQCAVDYGKTHAQDMTNDALEKLRAFIACAGDGTELTIR